MNVTIIANPKEPIIKFKFAPSKNPISPLTLGGSQAYEQWLHVLFFNFVYPSTVPFNIG